MSFPEILLFAIMAVSAPGLAITLYALASFAIAIIKHEQNDNQ